MWLLSSANNKEVKIGLNYNFGRIETLYKIE